MKRLALAALSLTLASVACSSSDSPAAAAGDASTADAGDFVCNAESVCRTAAEGKPPAEGSVCVKTVDVTTLDPSERPLADLSVTTCGTNLCIYGYTDASGHAHLEACRYLVKPAFKVLGGSSWVSFAAPLPDGEVVTFAKAYVTPLPVEGAPLAAGAEATSAGVTLAVAAGATLKVDKLNFPDADAQKFRAAVIDLAHAPPSVDASRGFGALFGLGPLDTTIDPPAKVTMPNTAGWAAGAVVEVWLHGVDQSEKYAPYGGWKQIGTATVSADGATVVTDDGAGNGVPELSIVALRKP